MLICKIVLQKFIHKVSGCISFDCHCYYSDTQQHSMCKLGNAQKRKMHVQLERLHLQDFYHINQLLNASLKRKTEHIFIIMRHVTTEKRAKGILCYKTLLIGDKKTIFHKNVHKSNISDGKCHSS